MRFTAKQVWEMLAFYAGLAATDPWILGLGLEGEPAGHAPVDRQPCDALAQRAWLQHNTRPLLGLSTQPGTHLGRRAPAQQIPPSGRQSIHLWDGGCGRID